ncbi:MAG TPA: tetratricopeptide repeat protein [Myxococcota bacterium]|nr:tetratricopeptide repeat protein [Myxococcota bacterium]
MTNLPSARTGLRSFLLLGLALSVGFATTACGPDKTPEVDESTITDPAYFFDRGVTTMKTPDSKTGIVDYQAAYDDFDKAIALGGGARAEFNAGWASERLGQPDRAERHYRKALEADSGYTAALTNLANALASAERHAEAIEIYRSYLSAKPDDLDMHNSLVNTLTLSGSYDEAITEAQKILQKKPDNVAAYRNLSRTYFAKGEYGMSQLCAEKAKTLQDGDPGIYNNMGVTYLQQEDLPAAIDAFKTAIKIDPDNVEANLNLGYVALDSGDYQQAHDCFSQVQTAAPENVDGLLGLAVAQRGLKQFDQASATYDRILEMDPSNEVAYFNASTLHEKYTKDFKKAKKVLQAYVDLNQGSIGPNHDVFARIDRIAESERLEQERVAEAERKRIEAEEREKRQKAQLEELKGRVASFNKKLDQANCPAVAEMGMLEDFAMIAEQGQMVVDAEDFQLAGDMITFLESYEPMLDDFIPMCAEAPAPEPTPEGGAVEPDGTAPEGDAPAPEEGGDEAPEAGGEEAPADDAPAEAPAEEPAPE